MKRNRRIQHKVMWLLVFVSAVLALSSAQILTGDEVKKLSPSSFFFAGQSATTQLRNTSGFKAADGKLLLAGLVDTAGYSTAIAEKYQGFLITEAKLSFAGTTLDPGEWIRFQGWEIYRNECGGDGVVFNCQSERRSAPASGAVEARQGRNQLSTLCWTQVCGGQARIEPARIEPCSRASGVENK
jgi:hypothetical protein